ncbi:protein kinase family protein [Luedemannella helvata]|uniref:Protein kinase domain-containing protein n=1 Tax=Luedemannella helvata TaxID=349315 RepID=A0ABN2KYN5_9ACTN
MTTHVGGGQDATPGATTPGAPGLTTGEEPRLLAGRYRLDEQINTDAAGRQIWRGVDVILRRQVALVIRTPGGDAAAGMITAAVAVSRVVHPHLAGVYDAVDEGDQAYVVREWVPGVSLRDIVTESTLGPEHATMVAHAVAEAVSALHAAGIVHGNIHPGTVLVADDGRVVLADTRADATATADRDVRCVGGILYFSLTGHWPLPEGGGGLPDAARDGAGRPMPLRHVRAGVPRQLDAMATELLTPDVQAPPAAALAADLARLVSQGPDHYDDAGPIAFRADPGPEPRRRSGSKLLVGVTVLVLIAAIGIFVGNKLFSSSDDGGTPTTVTPTQAVETESPGRTIPLRADIVRIVDPKGNGSEVAGVERAVDGDESTGWPTEHYTRADFGGLKPGMGVLINLGTPTKIRNVEVTFSSGGVTTALLAGPNDPGNNDAGDLKISKFDKAGSAFKTVGQIQEDTNGPRVVFPVDLETQVLVVWIAKMPPDGTGKFQVAVQEITVTGE